jgi:hypothetical protein
MRIDFYNRDGNGVWLEKAGEEEWWQLRIAQPSLFNYTRLIFEEEDNQGIYAVDPPGGPFISVGTEVGLGGVYIVEEIKNTSLGIFLLLKENKKV